MNNETKMLFDLAFELGKLCGKNDDESIIADVGFEPFKDQPRLWAYDGGESPCASLFVVIKGRFYEFVDPATCADEELQDALTEATIYENVNEIVAKYQNIYDNQD